MPLFGYGGPTLNIGDDDGDGDIDFTPGITLGVMGLFGLGSAINKLRGGQNQQQDQQPEYHDDGYYDRRGRWHYYK